MIGMFDEAQDFTPLELAVVRLWSSPPPPGHPQLGVPKYPRHHSQAILPCLASSLRLSGCSVSTCLPMNRERCWIWKALTGNRKSGFQRSRQHLDQFQTVMILASCSYMLTPIIQFLKQQAVPFSNTYRRKRRDLEPPGPRQTTAATRVKDYFGWLAPGSDDLDRGRIGALAPSGGQGSQARRQG